MHLTTAQSSLIVLGIYLAFGLLELASTRLFSKDEQTRHERRFSLPSLGHIPKLRTKFRTSLPVLKRQ